MARINLLPWREQLREERKKQFVAALVGSAIIAAGLVFLAAQYLSNAIDNQNSRNQFVQNEIIILDKRIKEISELKARKQVLLERMKIIQDLQGNRSITARVFDQMTRTLPDGLYYNKVKVVGSKIDIDGASESNNRVSELMRNMDASEWLTAPNLGQVKATTAGAVDQANTFALTVKQTKPSAELEEGVKK